MTAYICCPKIANNQWLKYLGEREKGENWLFWQRPLDCRLRQTANARHSVGYKNKIIDREIYYI